MIRKTKPGEHPHIGLAVFAAGAMALALCVGLGFLGLIRVIDARLGAWFSLEGMNAPALALSPAALWFSTALIAFALPAVILNIPGCWRRMVVWGGTLALTLAWGPVLVLAAHKPQIGVALVAVLWSGFCAMFYTTNHVLPVDHEDATPQRKDDGPR